MFAKKLVEDGKKAWEEIEQEIKDRFKAKRSKADAEYTEQKRVRRFIEFFYAGRACICGNASDVKAICLGVRYKSKSVDNIHRPSNLAVRFATSDSSRLLEYTLAKNDTEDMSAVFAKSSTLTTGNYDREADERYLNRSFMQDWEQMCSSSQANRRKRYIITGNMLKGYAKALQDNPNRPVVLINFTLQDGGTEKGILFPEDFDPANNGNLKRQFTRKVNEMRPFLLNDPTRFYSDGLTSVKFKLATPAGTCTFEVSGDPKSDEGWKRRTYIEILTPARKAADKDFTSDPRWVDLSRSRRGFENHKSMTGACFSFQAQVDPTFDDYDYTTHTNRKKDPDTMMREYRDLMGKILDILSDPHVHSGKKFGVVFVFTPEEVQKFFGENTEIAESNADAPWEPASFDRANIPASKKGAKDGDTRIRIAKAKIKIAKAKIAIAEQEYKH